MTRCLRRWSLRGRRQEGVGNSTAAPLIIRGQVHRLQAGVHAQAEEEVAIADVGIQDDGDLADLAVAVQSYLHNANLPRIWRHPGVTHDFFSLHPIQLDVAATPGPPTLIISQTLHQRMVPELERQEVIQDVTVDRRQIKGEELGRGHPVDLLGLPPEDVMRQPLQVLRAQQPVAKHAPLNTENNDDD